MAWWLPILSIAAGAGLSAANKSKQGQSINMTQYPEYPESEEARKKWWEVLQRWGSDSNYGAITPDWDNIWNLTQKKIKEYYQGSALAPGVKDRLKSSLARRNMSSSPAYDYLMMAADSDMGRKLEEAAVQEGIQKTNLAESGRQTWLNSLTDLSKQKPNFNTTTSTTGGNSLLDILGSVLTTAGTTGLQINAANEQKSWIEELLNKSNGSVPSTTQSSLVGSLGSSSSLYDKLFS